LKASLYASKDLLGKEGGKGAGGGKGVKGGKGRKGMI
jgi:hypothetical protein